MTEYEAWIKLCGEIGSEITKVEESDKSQTGLFKTQKKFMHENREYGADPIFHAWYKGTRLYCGSSYVEAKLAYDEAVKLGSYGK